MRKSPRHRQEQTWSRKVKEAGADIIILCKRICWSACQRTGAVTSEAGWCWTQAEDRLGDFLDQHSIIFAGKRKVVIGSRTCVSGWKQWSWWRRVFSKAASAMGFTDTPKEPSFVIPCSMSPGCSPLSVCNVPWRVFLNPLQTTKAVTAMVSLLVPAPDGYKGPKAVSPAQLVPPRGHHAERGDLHTWAFNL